MFNSFVIVGLQWSRTTFANRLYSVLLWLVSRRRWQVKELCQGTCDELDGGVVITWSVMVIILDPPDFSVSRHRTSTPRGGGITDGQNG